MEGGIYKIQNKVNGKLYVGRTKNFQRRFKQYEYDFKHRRLRHINDYLMNSMEKYGFENFEFTPLEYCEYEIQPERELFWMEFLNSTHRDFGYNLRVDTDNGMVINPRTSEKITQRLKKEWADGVRDGHSDKIKESWKTRCRKDQSKVMTKTLTKWLYIVEGEKMLYADLKENGLEGVLTSFCTKRSDKVVFKGREIERVEYEYEP